MTFPQRNELIDEMLVKYKMLHDKYSNNKRILTDEEWKEYVDSMDSVANQYKDSKIINISGKLCMLFLDDTEMIQKKLIEKEQLGV